jgi:hypothetical protein
MIVAILAAVQLITLHTPDGREVAVAPEQVTSLTSSKENQENKLITGAAHCLVNLADGKFISVREDCIVVRKALEDAK